MKPLQWKAVDLLADGATQKKAAEQCGVAAFTIRRWQKRLDFQDALRKEVQKLREKNRERLCREFETSVANISAHKSARF
jgi:transposase